MQEIWKDIKGYEGLYQISNLGRVKSLERYKQNHSKKQIVKEKILVPRVRGLYKSVSLWKHNKGKEFTIHRLVAKTFIDNPDNFLYINHKDGDKLNNYVSNLEWCTQSHNIKEAYRIGLIKPRKHTAETKIKISNSKKGKSNKQEKTIICIESNIEYSSIKEASEKNNISKGGICNCCKGKRKTAGGYHWKYKDII
jgi:hypothetical protein